MARTDAVRRRHLARLGQAVARLREELAPVRARILALAETEGTRPLTAAEAREARTLRLDLVRLRLTLEAYRQEVEPLRHQGHQGHHAP
jgi:hypothetical protein